MATAILYGKPECHLCEQAAAILDELTRERGLTWRSVDITQDADLFDRFRDVIPVIKVEGGPTLEWPTTAERVRRALAAADANGHGER